MRPIVAVFCYLDVEGECSMAVDMHSADKLQSGEAFHIQSALGTNNKRNFELIVEFTHGVGTVKLVHETLFDQGLQSLQSKWKIQSVNLVPTPYEIAGIKSLPFIQWVLETIRPMQQTNYRLAQKTGDSANNFSAKLESQRDLYTLDMWSEGHGQIIRVNMASAPQFAWGNVPRTEKSDAVFWGTNNQFWGCSNFLEQGRGGLTLEACSRIMNDVRSPLAKLSFTKFH